MRLGDLDALKETINNVVDEEMRFEQAWAMGLKYSLKLIDNAPTAEITDYDTGYQDGLEDGLNDIRPQGEWQVKDGLREGFYICSNCGEISCCKGNFCPDCGAYMRGENE